MALGRIPRYDGQMTADKVKRAYSFKQHEQSCHSGTKLSHEKAKRPEYSSVQKAVLMRSMKIFSILGTAFLFIALWMTFYSETIINRLPTLFEADISVYLEAILLVFYAVLIMRLGRIYHAYEAGLIRVSEIIYSQALANFFSEAIVYILVCITSQHFMNPLPLLAIVTAQSIWSALWGIFVNKLYFHLYPPQPTLILYKATADLWKIEQIRFFASRFDVRDRIENPEDVNMVLQSIQGNKVVFIAGVEGPLRDKTVCYCFKEGIQCFVTPAVSDIVMARAEHMKMFCTPVMHVRLALLSPEYHFIKRAFDIVGSMIGIVAASPFMIITALAIKLYDGGPVLYKQVRLTKGYREFEILKFRSMCVDAEKDGVARFARTSDERITPIGKVIRAIRFDELPQLLNILKGDMTFIGPRPERPEIVAQYQNAIPNFGLRLQVKAGLTGYAQIYGKYNTEPEDKLQLDLMYINKMSVIEDIKIIFYTVKILFLPESTEGFEADKQTVIDIRNKSERAKGNANHSIG